MSNAKKSKGKKTERQSDFMLYLMCLCPFLTGLQQPYLAMLASLIIFLVLVISKRYERIRIYRNPMIYSMGLIFLCSLGTVFYGYTHGDAAYGAMLVAGSLIYAAYMMNCYQEEKSRALDLVPDVAVFMVVICAGMYLIPDLRQLVFEAGRLAGFFGYCNTMALFLMIALLIFTMSDAYEKRKKWQRYVYPIVLLGGVLWTGSRTSFVLLIILIAALIWKKREVRAFYGGITIVGLAAVIGYSLLSGADTGIARILNFAQSSTLMGRFLYWQDALGMILKRPLGWGYLGYFYAQQQFATGVYTVRWVHNEWLQIALDYGIIALVALVVFFIFAVKNTSGWKRWVIVLTGAHMFMDMDLQFVVIIWMVLTCVNMGSDREWSLDLTGKTRVPVLIGGICLMGLTLWLGSADLLNSLSMDQASDAIYPWRIDSKENSVLAALDQGDVDETEKYSNQLIALNPYDGVPYDALARVYMTEGDYYAMVTAKRQGVLNQPYRLEEYEDYIDQLEMALEYYKDSDTEKYEACVDLLQEVPVLLTAVEERTSGLAYKITDQPEFELSQEAQAVVDAYK